MQTCWYHIEYSTLKFAVIFFLCGDFFCLSAAEIRLKNGTVLRGKLLEIDCLSDRVDVFVETNSSAIPNSVRREIFCVDHGWKRIYFPFHQRVAIVEDQQPDLVTENPVTFVLPRSKRQSNKLITSTFGAIRVTDPFCEFGRRRLTVGTKKKDVYVFQAITEISPDHVLVESTNCDWRIALTLNSIPNEILDPLLKKQVRWDDPHVRSELVRFYAQAGRFSKAFEELTALENDFLENHDIATKCRTHLLNLHGSDSIRRIEQKKRGGQYIQAQKSVECLLKHPMSDSVRQRLLEEATNIEQARQVIERVKSSLSQCQSQLQSDERRNEVQRLSIAINENIDFDTLPRLEAFVQSESDTHFGAEQRLALAISGWILGSAHAISDLNQALRLWHVRDSVLEYLRGDGLIQQEELFKRIESAEGITPQLLMNLVVHLPPILDTCEIGCGLPHQVATASNSEIRYSVMLPPEYSPNHSYPLVIALHSGNQTPEKALWVWAGDAINSDRGGDRGYIIIAPEYAEENLQTHSFADSVHKHVLECLMDARKRFAVDSDRVFLVGHGMGGDAAFEIGLAHPDEFAGVLPIGGNAINTSVSIWENSYHTAWFVIGKGFDAQRTRDGISQPVLDKIMKRSGETDFMLVEYLGCNGEDIQDELPKLFDWMDLHIRPKQRPQFTMRSSRRSGERFYWVTASLAPRGNLVSVSLGTNRKKPLMEVDARVIHGNIIDLKSPATNYELRLSPELIDFEKRLLVRIGERVEFNNFVKPDIRVLLDELRLRGDRQRLPFALISI